jgi:hypothetical protein
MGRKTRPNGRVRPRDRGSSATGPAGLGGPEVAGDLYDGRHRPRGPRGVATEPRQVRLGHGADPSSEAAASQAKSQPNRGQSLVQHRAAQLPPRRRTEVWEQRGRHHQQRDRWGWLPRTTPRGECSGCARSRRPAHRPWPASCGRGRAGVRVASRPPRRSRVLPSTLARPTMAECRPRDSWSAGTDCPPSRGARNPSHAPRAKTTAWSCG